MEFSARFQGLRHNYGYNLEVFDAKEGLWTAGENF
jgi:hypothetical protein